MNEDFGRIKRISELKNPSYPDKMLWFPVQDVLTYVKKRKSELQGLSDYEAGLVELEQIAIRIRNAKANLSEVQDNKLSVPPRNSEVKDE